LVGEGLHQKNVIEEDSVVNFEDDSQLPHTADNDLRGIVPHIPTDTDFEEDRPGRSRRKYFNRYNIDSLANNSIEVPNGGDSGRFNSLILAKRIKNENSRML